MKKLPLKLNSLLWLVATTITLLAVALLAFLVFFRHQPDPETVFYNSLEAQLNWQEPAVHYTYTQEASDYNLKREVYFNEAENKLAYKNSGQLIPIDVNGVVGVFQEETTCGKNASYSRQYSLKPPFSKTSAAVAESYRDFFKMNQNTWSRQEPCTLDFIRAKDTANYQNFKLFIGKLAPEKRQAVVTKWKNDNLFQTDFSKTKKMHRDGKLLYSYEVTSDTEALMAFLRQDFPDQVKRFVEDRITVSKRQVPLNLVDNKTVKFTVTIDSATFELSEIRYRTDLSINLVGFTNYDGFIEKLKQSPYGKKPLDVMVRFDYGKTLNFKEPEQSISFDELIALRQQQNKKAQQLITTEARNAEN